MSTEPMRASIRIHTDASDEVGEFVSLFVNAAAAAAGISELRAAFGGRLESSYVLHRADGRIYRVWCV